MKNKIIGVCCVFVLIVTLFSGCKNTLVSPKELKGTPSSICGKGRRIWYLIGDRNETMIPEAYCIIEKGKMLYFPNLTNDLTLYDFADMSDDEVVDKLYKLRKDIYIDNVMNKNLDADIPEYNEPQFKPIKFDLVKDEKTNEIVFERVYTEQDRLVANLENQNNSQSSSSTVRYKYKYRNLPVNLVFIRQGEYTVKAGNKVYCGFQTVADEYYHYDDGKYYWLTSVESDSKVELDLDAENKSDITVSSYDKNETYSNNHYADFQWVIL